MTTKKNTGYGLYRNIYTKIWNDSKVSDDFSKDDIYLFMYFLTSPYSNNIGFYEVSKKQIAYDTKMTIEDVDNIMSELQNKLKVIQYDEDTKEVLILNFCKYNVNSSSEKNLINANKQIAKVKSNKLLSTLKNVLCAQNGIYVLNDNNTLSIAHEYPIEAEEELEEELELEKELEKEKEGESVCSATSKGKGKGKPLGVSDKSLGIKSNFKNLKSSELNKIANKHSFDINELVNFYGNLRNNGFTSNNEEINNEEKLIDLFNKTKEYQEGL